MSRALTSEGFSSLLKAIGNNSSQLVRFSILILALSNGLLHAAFLPPWGVIDEAHHVDYIRHLAEEGSVPIVGETYLSSEIIESLFETRRWEAFHWNAPSSRDPRDMGFGGHSYEGYHPPLYYALLAPAYRALPEDILAKLHCLRLGMVVLSLVTVWMAGRIASEVFPRHPIGSYSASVLLAVLPARAMWVSRVNNDVLLEVIATAFVWVCTRAILEGLSVRRSQLLGMLLGLGVLTKTSMIVLLGLLPFIFWTNRHKSHLWRHLLWIGGIALVMIVPLALRNFRLYGDLTGLASFEALNENFAVFQAPDLTWRSFALALWSLFSHLWMVWWKGVEATTNPVVNGFYIMMAVLSGLSLAGIMHYIRRENEETGRDRSKQVIIMYLFAIGIYAAAVLLSYFDGKIPVIQGRFLLPVVVPLAILLSWGLWDIFHRKSLLLLSFALLVVVGVLSLFGNLLPYSYYWSAFTSNSAPAPHASLDWGERWTVFYQRFLRDKLPGMRPVLPVLPLLYLASLTVTAIAFVKIPSTAISGRPGYPRSETSETS